MIALKVSIEIWVLGLNMAIGTLEDETGPSPAMSVSVVIIGLRLNDFGAILLVSLGPFTVVFAINTNGYSVVGGVVFVGW